MSINREYNPKDFDYDGIKKEIFNHWRKWALDTNTSKIVVGISGGKDSSVVAALGAELFGKENVLGVLMPDGNQPDIADSYALVEHLGIPYIEINIATPVASLLGSIMDNNGNEVSEQTVTNLPARIRMATLFAVAQTFGGKVMNTCNASENYVGYSTLFGDDCGAYSPLKDLYATQVQELGVYLGLPKSLAKKAPSDGLCGKTDEDNLGFTYLELDTYLYVGERIDDTISLSSLANICERHKKNAFKEELIRLPGPRITPNHYHERSTKQDSSGGFKFGERYC